MISPIIPLHPVSGPEGIGAADTKTRQGGNVFEDVLRSAIENVKQTDSEYGEAQYLMATGQLDNPAALMISAAKVETAVDMLVQLRDRSLNAYSELMRISL